MNSSWILTEIRIELFSSRVQWTLPKSNPRPLDCETTSATTCDMKKGMNTKCYLSYGVHIAQRVYSFEERSKLSWADGMDRQSREQRGKHAFTLFGMIAVNSSFRWTYAQRQTHALFLDHCHCNVYWHRRNFDELNGAKTITTTKKLFLMKTNANDISTNKIN